MVKVCILGGTGFLGRHLCEQFHAKGLPAFTVSRNPDRVFLTSHASTIVDLTLGSYEADQVLATCDVLIHLASSSLPGINWDDPAQELARSTLAEVQFLQSFARANSMAHIIYASSGGQIYGSGHNSPINEDAHPAPCTAYALGKQVTEAALNCLSAVQGNAVTILRLANPVGKWQVGRKHGLVSTAIAAALAGEPITLFGDGNNVRDYFDADDLAMLLINLTFGAKPGTKTYNIGSNQGLTEREVVSLVSMNIGSPLELLFSKKRPFDLRYSLLDSSRAQKEIDWRPSTSIDASIQKIFNASL